MPRGRPRKPITPPTQKQTSKTSEAKFMSKIGQDGFVERNIEKLKVLRSWMLWYPDLVFDLMSPAIGGLKLCFDQRVGMRCDSRFSAFHTCQPRGSAKCVAPDTLINTEDGLVQISSIIKNCSKEEEIEPINIVVNNGVGGKSVSNIGIYSGVQETRCITTRRGYFIEGTKRHPIVVMNSNGDLSFKCLSDLKIGDYVAINRTNGLFGTCVNIDFSQQMNEWYDNLPPNKKKNLKVRQMPTTMNEDIAYFLGLLIGDGCMTIDRVIIFSNIDEIIISEYKRILSQYFGTSFLKFDGRCSYRVDDTYLKKYIEMLGVGNADSHSKSIPNSILSAPKNIQASFLQGLFDTDGCVTKNTISYCTVSKKMIQQVHVLLLNLGIISTIKARIDKNGRTSYVLNIYCHDCNLYANSISFKCNHKLERLNELCAKKRNPNLDVIPFQQSYIKKVQDMSYGKFKDMHELTYNIRTGQNELSYTRLQKILEVLNGVENAEVDHLRNLYSLHYYFDQVSNIDNKKNDVYDIHVPDAHSFVSNGFISHNTFSNIWVAIIDSIVLPAIEIAISAQTKENAAELLNDKYNELLRWVPALQNEVAKYSHSKNDSEVLFRNKARLDKIKCPVVW